MKVFFQKIDSLKTYSDEKQDTKFSVKKITSNIKEIFNNQVVCIKSPTAG